MSMIQHNDLGGTDWGKKIQKATREDEENSWGSSKVSKGISAK